jgi:molecular chaperone DnaK (HSP70)
MTELKTKESTLAALEEAASRRLTAAEIQKQRISFIMGSLDAKSPITREKVEKLLAEQRGAQAAP